MSRLPTIFAPHGGGPCFFMEWNPPGTWDRMAAYLRQIPEDIGARPKAIVLISGHWEEEVVTIQNNTSPPLLYDYYGFPPHTYEIKFPAAGAPELSARIAALLGEAGIDWKYDHGRGFDHGVFIPLKVAFPNADVPIVQVSLLASLDAEDHIRLGQALAPLRDEGVLIIGSGMTYHNMQTMMASMRGGGVDVGSPDPGSQRFDAWLEEVLTKATPENRIDALAAWHKAPAARDAHPREEHLLPLHVAVGAAGTDPGRKTLTDVVMGAVESAFRFG
ncbi:class III extradiol ring-cleavage dioxygenase [Parvibaculum sp.]|uniref:DODA-type extradiol aromatic ring-opening family dioxygenase n=1 Tax=Parvibaculum sp. TaxID=2024848 RepID=UPI00320FBB7E